VKEYKEEAAPNPKKSFFKLEMDAFTLDFLPQLKSSARFQLSFNDKETIDIHGTQIWFVSYHDLIKDKAISARPKDLIDLAQLKNKKGG
jgi:hypothetical protein